MGIKLKAAGTSILVNCLLLISKMIAAALTGSIALLAETFHSLFDLVASFLAFWGIKRSEKMHDDCHPYGHEKFENLSSFLQSLLIAITALLVMKEAYEKIIDPRTIENPLLGIILMIVSIPVTYFTARYLSKIAKQSGGSSALDADSAHFTTDVIASIAVLTGLFFVKIGYPIGDSIAAMIVAASMIYISYHLIKDCYHVFMDHSPDKYVMDSIKKELERMNVKYHKLRARRAGSKVLLDFHRETDGNKTVAVAHKESNRIREHLMKSIPELKDVNIQIQPRKN